MSAKDTSQFDRIAEGRAMAANTIGFVVFAMLDGGEALNRDGLIARLQAIADGTAAHPVVTDISARGALKAISSPP